jgi:hypothetical protein
VYVEAEIRRGSCTGEVLYREEVAVSAGAGSGMPGVLPPGTYALKARARDASCIWFASGCLVLVLPFEGEAIVELEVGAEMPQCPLALCAEGRCVDLDAGSGLLDGDAGADAWQDAGADACVAADERCNERDDDCDGRVDETFDLATDPMNCGQCGRSCGARASCSDGRCECDPGYGDCDGDDANGCEVDTQTDPTHCGMCRRNCGFYASCSSGSCVCNPGYGDCDDNRFNGCEQELNRRNHCGACGVICLPANAVATCSTGTCQIVMCNAGYGDCDGNPTNGCEVDTRTDAMNCGMCGRSCGANASCSSGSCVCNAGFGNCDGNDANGCEQALTTLSHCGACGVMCSRANATATCSTGVCRISSCNAGFGNCDGNDANGCEQALNTLSHCGACGVMCSRANATATCSTGMCRISTCNAGFGDCDGNDANGCETDLRTSNMHCGMCGRSCPAGMCCSSGMCGGGACVPEL